MAERTGGIARTRFSVTVRANATVGALSECLESGPWSARTHSIEPVSNTPAPDGTV